jgi:hypothetical protein
MPKINESLMCNRPVTITLTIEDGAFCGVHAEGL